MSDYLYIKYSGEAVTGAFNISYTEMLDGKDQFKFQYPNQLHENFEAWDARINGADLEIWDSTGTDTLRMKGVVTSVTDSNPLQVTGEGEIVKLTWTTVTPERAKFQVDEVYIKTEPVDENIECITDKEDEPDPGWVDGQWTYTDQSPKYAIISDNTIEESTESDLQASAASGTSSPGNSTNETNDEDSTQTEDATFWQCEFNDAENNYHYMKACINLDSAALGEGNKITKIDIDLRGRCGAKNLNTLAGAALWGIFWTPDGTWGNTILLQTVSHNRSTPAYSYTAFAMFKGVHTILLTPEDNTNEAYFYKEEGTWHGGYIYIRQLVKAPFHLDIGTAYSKIDIDYLSVDVSYQSLDLATINRKIKDTVNDVGGVHDELILLDDDESSDYDASGKGISIGDKVTIGIGMTEAFARCFQGERTQAIGAIINGGEWIDVGIGDDLGPQDQYSLFTTLAERNNFVFFSKYFNYESETNTTIYCLDPDDIDAAVVTYSADSDPPSNTSIQSSGEGEYGYIRVIYKNGITSLIQADTPSSSPVEKTVTKKDILTLREAKTYGKTYANQHASKRYSISCDWDFYPTNLPHVGTKYNVTVSKVGVGTIAFTDQICRTVTVTQDGGYGQWKIHAEFGLLSTSGEEWMGMQIAEAHNKIKRDIALSLTGQYSPVTRHPQLNAVTEEQHRTTAQVRAYADDQIAAASIGDLSDVDLTDIDDGKMLQYSDGDSAFVCVDVPSSGIGPPTDADVTYILTPNGLTDPISQMKQYDCWGGKNVGSTDFTMAFTYQIPSYDGYHFVWKTTIVRTEDGDAGDYVTHTYLRTYTSTAMTAEADNAEDFSEGGAETWTWNHDDIDCTGKIGLGVILSCFVTNADDLDIRMVSITGRWTAD